MVAAFLDNSVRLLQRPLVSAVQDFGNLSIDLQACGLSQYQTKLENQDVELKDLIHAKEEDLQAGNRRSSASSKANDSLCWGKTVTFYKLFDLILPILSP